MPADWCRGLGSVLIPLQPQKDNHRNGRATNPVSALLVSLGSSRQSSSQTSWGQQQDRAARGKCGSWGLAGLGVLLLG